jgi:two-component system cell cycle response regulator CpdR
MKSSPAPTATRRSPRSTQTFDLLLTDIVMPGIDGIEVARIAAQRHPAVRIMFITGFAAVALSAPAERPPGAKVLSKPVHLREIVAEVEKMMAPAA